MASREGLDRTRGGHLNGPFNFKSCPFCGSACHADGIVISRQDGAIAGAVVCDNGACGCRFVFSPSPVSPWERFDTRSADKEIEELKQEVERVKEEVGDDW